MGFLFALAILFLLRLQTNISAVAFGCIVAVMYGAIRTLVLRSRRLRFETPACARCSDLVGRLDARHRSLEISSAFVAVAALTVLKASGYDMALRAWAYTSLAFLAVWVVGCVVWLVKNQRPVNASTAGTKVMFEFTNKSYVQEFRALNMNAEAAG